MAYHIYLVKIPPFYLLWLFDAFDYSDNSYKNEQSENVSNWRRQTNVIVKI